ncbi:hypothetical protein QR680_018379 [Steinernema hermaphroditum]|uniref:Uncharacterized protein n=1 Tax=Steinernema hermaphroditum TaxID=289476 RepID=A0AA39HHS3_9BILA|nr:hypothetical protein QR680_018379 [Steinernema hermaphroditum]
MHLNRDEPEEPEEPEVEGRLVEELQDAILKSSSGYSTVQRIRSNDSEHFPALPPVAFGFLPSTNETTTRIIFNPNTYQSIFFALNVFGNAQLGRRNAIDFSLESLPGFCMLTTDKFIAPISMQRVTRLFIRTMTVSKCELRDIRVDLPCKSGEFTVLYHARRTPTSWPSSKNFTLDRFETFSSQVIFLLFALFISITQFNRNDQDERADLLMHQE